MWFAKTTNVPKPPMVPIVNTLLDALSTLKKPQKTFITLLLEVLMVFQGKATFRNLSRYSAMSEKRLSRWYRRQFPFAQFNQQLLSRVLGDQGDCIAVIDASFMAKSGKRTEGLGQFYHGAAAAVERGLEISLVSVVDLHSNTAYSIEAQQTLDQDNKTRADLYAEHILKVAASLRQLNISHIVCDAWYSKLKFVKPVTAAGFHVVGKLRCDADLLWLYTGTYCGSGRPKRFDGKVDFDRNLKRFDQVGTFDDGVEVYTQRLYSNFMKRTIRVVMLSWLNGKTRSRTLLYSTDTELDAMTLIKYYKARFQIEFQFRDAKQHTGLVHCQSTKKEAIHTQVNASLTALNLLKAEDRQEKQTADQTVISIASWKRRKFNQHLMQRLFDQLGLSREDKKVAQAYFALSDYGAITA
jgi:hypothetical protein